MPHPLLQLFLLDKLPTITEHTAKVVTLSPTFHPLPRTQTTLPKDFHCHGFIHKDNFQGLPLLCYVCCRRLGLYCPRTTYIHWVILLYGKYSPSALLYCRSVLSFSPSLSRTIRSTASMFPFSTRPATNHCITFRISGVRPAVVSMGCLLVLTILPAGLLS